MSGRGFTRVVFSTVSVLFSVLFVSLAAASLTFAQSQSPPSTATITGVIRDASGSPVSGATILVINERSGTSAHDVCAGVLDRGDFTGQIQIVSSLERVSAAVADWHGAVFVKGSRRYQLEKILEVQTSLPFAC